MTEEEVFAFVLMPFSTDFDDIYKLGIKETASSLNIIAERVDEQIFQEGILERIYRQIDSADIIIADMSRKNPNVFYEVGYAHGKGKLCILLTESSDAIPFDLKHHRHTIYNGSISQLRKSLTDDLVWAKSKIANERESRIRVQLESATGNLELTKYWAEGSVDIRIDLFNDTSDRSPEIEAIYFYVNNKWEVSQDGVECSSTDSDIPQAKERHFIRSPVKRLQGKSWAQLRFTAKKHLAYATRGEELKNSYKVGGRCWLRIVTDQGHFDYELFVEATCDEIPF